LSQPVAEAPLDYLTRASRRPGIRSPALRP